MRQREAWARPQNGFLILALQTSADLSMAAHKRTSPQVAEGPSVDVARKSAAAKPSRPDYANP
jgi:hypothetical protein